MKSSYRAVYDHIVSMNRPVLDLDDSHPAKRFLRAFLDCRTNCSERELDIGEQVGIDQKWHSSCDGRVWTFSGFVYSYICFDIELDGFLRNLPYPTSSEAEYAKVLPRLRSLMHECADAARQDGNDEIFDLTDDILRMFDMWEQYLEYRRAMIPWSPG